MIMEKVYQSDSNASFSLLGIYQSDWNRWFDRPVVVDHYAIAHAHQDYSGFENPIEKYQPVILAKHDLCILQWKTKCMSKNAIQDFRSDILHTMINWESRFLGMILDHFKSRCSDKKPLLANDSIKISIGSLITDLSHANALLAVSSAHHLVWPHVKRIALKLHKLSGARGFLQKNIVEMLAVFELIAKIYFRCGHES